MEDRRPPSPQPQTNGGAATGASAPPARGGGGGGVPSWQNNKARCYIGNLIPEITEADVRTHFAKYFPKRCDMKGGYAFIEFETETDAVDAVRYMDGTTLLERRIHVRPAGDRREREREAAGRGAPFEYQQRPPMQQGAPRQAYGYRVEVENLAPRTSWQDLKDFGRRAGNSVKYAEVFEGPSGRCGVISWALEEDMRRAVATLHEQPLDGNVVRVYEDKTNSGPRGAPTKNYGTPIQYQSGGGAAAGGYGRDQRDQWGPPPRGDPRDYDRDPRDAYRGDPRDAYRSDPRSAYDPRDSYARRRSPSPRRGAPVDDHYRRRRSPSPPSSRRAPLPDVAAPMEASSSSSRHHSGHSSGHHSSSHRSGHRSRSRSRDRDARYRARSPERGAPQGLPSPPPPAVADPYARRGGSRSRSPPSSRSHHDAYGAQQAPMPAYRDERRR